MSVFEYSESEEQFQGIKEEIMDEWGIDEETLNQNPSLEDKLLNETQEVSYKKFGFYYDDFL